MSQGDVENEGLAQLANRREAECSAAEGAGILRLLRRWRSGCAQDDRVGRGVD